MREYAAKYAARRCSVPEEDYYLIAAGAAEEYLLSLTKQRCIQIAAGLSNLYILSRQWQWALVRGSPVVVAICLL